MSDCKNCPLDTYGPGPTNYGRNMVPDFETPSTTEGAWTATPPTEPGRYWARPLPHFDAEVVRVRLTDAGLVVNIPMECVDRPLSDIALWWPVCIEEPPCCISEDGREP